MPLDRLYFVNRPATSLPGLQRDVYEFTKRLKDFLLQAHLFTKLLRDVTVARDETIIEHGLGYVPSGWRVLSPDLPCSIYQTREPDTKYLYLANGQTASGEDWATSERRRLLRLCGLPEARAGSTWDGFHAPGKAAASNDFGERWDLTLGSGAGINHQTAGGTTWRNGVCVIEQNSTSWTDNHLLWKGPGIVQDDATEKWAIAYRMKQHLRPAASAFNNMYYGMANAAVTKFVLFGYDESVDATYCVLYVAGLAQVVSTFPIASLSAGECTIEVVRKESPTGQRLAIAYVNGTEVARSTTDGTFTNMKPYFACNKGTTVTDDMLFVCDSAFVTSPVDSLGDGSVVVTLEVI